jgi:hypothetical protein
VFWSPAVSDPLMPAVWFPDFSARAVSRGDGEADEDGERTEKCEVLVAVQVCSWAGISNDVSGFA